MAVSSCAVFCDSWFMDSIEEHHDHATLLKQAQHRFEKVFHLSPVPTSLTVLADARILDVNEAFHS